MIIYAIDDEPVLLKKLSSCIRQAEPDAELYSFSRATPFLQELTTGRTYPDVAFLDIEIPGIGGIELAKQIKKYSPETWIIFVTGFSQYALEAFSLHANGYVTKPVTVEKIREELNQPCPVPLPRYCNERLRVKCFGNFEVFSGEEPLCFSRGRTKELLAFLVDRNGAAANTNEICAAMFESDTANNKAYIRKLISDLQNTLDEYGFENVFLKQRNSFSVNVSELDSDIREYRNGNLNLYYGEYMTQYSWAEFEKSKF